LGGAVVEPIIVAIPPPGFTIIFIDAFGRGTLIGSMVIIGLLAGLGMTEAE